MKTLIAHIITLGIGLLSFANVMAQSEFQPDSLIFDADNYEPDHVVGDSEFVYEYSAFIANKGEKEREVVRFKIVDDGWLIDYGDYVHNYFPFWPVMSFEVADAEGNFHHTGLHYSTPILPEMRLTIKLRSVNKNSIPDVMWEKHFQFDKSGFMGLYEILYYQADGVHYGERTVREQKDNTLKTTNFKLIGKEWYRTKIDITTKNKMGKITHQEIHQVDMTTDEMVKMSVMDATYDRKGRTTSIVTYKNSAGVLQGGDSSYEDYGSNNLDEDRMWRKSEMSYGLFGHRKKIVEYKWENGKWVKAHVMIHIGTDREDDKK